jgi:UDP-N-acetylmuramyl pentapeptide synthase
VRREDGRLLYLDCYNANPSSMADALSAFCALAPEGEPRLFVLGCMEELGAEAVRFHRELGRALPLRAGDSAVVIGGNAASVLAGAVEGGSPGRIEAAGSAEDVAARVAGFRGSVFVKGSRRHQLERVVGEAVHA